jgi:hypothetical protein
MLNLLIINLLIDQHVMLLNLDLKLNIKMLLELYMISGRKLDLINLLCWRLLKFWIKGNKNNRKRKKIFKENNEKFKENNDEIFNSIHLSYYITIFIIY